jgi:hypothetical protein
MALVALALFITLVVVAVTALTVAIAYVDCCVVNPLMCTLTPRLASGGGRRPPSPAMALPQQRHHLPLYSVSPPSLMLC